MAITQRLFLVVGLALVTLNALFPVRQQYGTASDGGRAFILSENYGMLEEFPKVHGAMFVVDIGVLLTESIALGSLTALAICLVSIVAKRRAG